jgi:hypothetical protein
VTDPLLIDVLARAMTRFAPAAVEDERRVRDALAAAQEAGETWFHGGRPGLAAGDYILPPSETGMPTYGDIVRELDPAAWAELDSRQNTRADRVYAGPAALAVQYACLWTVSPFAEGDGAVYAVRPDGEDEPDPQAAGCRQCSRAVITRVVVPAVTRRYTSRCGSAIADDYIGRWLRDMHRARSSGGLPAAGYEARTEALIRQMLRGAAADAVLDRIEPAARQLGARRT